MGFEERLAEVRTGFERSFWVANVSELFERLSYYAAFASLARYLHEALNFPTERAADFSGSDCRPAGVSAGAGDCVPDSGGFVFFAGVAGSAMAGAVA